MNNKIPKKVIALGLLNAIWVVSAISIIFTQNMSVGSTLFILILGVPFLVATASIFLHKKWAFYFLLIFYIALGIEMNFSAFSWAVYFGPILFLHIMNSPIGANPFVILLLVILIKSKRWILTGNEK
jgi:hypothetical protein